MEGELQETERSLAKAGKACKVISVLMKVIIILLCAWWLLSIAVMIGSLVFPGKIDNPNPVNATALLFYIAHSIAVFVMCITLVQIFSDASRGKSPFAMLQVRRLRLVSGALVAYAVFEFGLTCSTTFMQQDWISASTKLAPTLNLFPIIAAAVVFAFSFVFKYGVLLQELSDETL